MCNILKVSRQGVYTYVDSSEKVDEYAEKVTEVFYDSHGIYGTRKIKAVLTREGVILSRRRISRIMRDNNLVSVYTNKKYRPYKSKVNESTTTNAVNREFDDRQQFEVVVSDLTYVRVGHTWNYICTIIDLHNREIVGYSCGQKKNAELVHRAFAKIHSNLGNIKYFHSDRGSEFDNYLIDDVLSTFGIKRSLSRKGNPYDNAVAETQFKTIKTEFVRKHIFSTLAELDCEFGKYVEWFNSKRLHAALEYKTPLEYKQHSIINLSI